MAAVRLGKAIGTVRWLMAWLVFALIAIATTVYFVLVSVPSERAAAIEVWRSRLSAMVDDRKAAIDEWLDERRSDAAVVAGYPTVAALLAVAEEAPPAFPASDLPLHQLQGLLDTSWAVHAYSGIYVVDASGEVRASSTGSPPLAARCREYSERAVRSGLAEVDFHTHTDGSPMVAVAVPVRVQGRAIGTVLLSVDPRRWLYPLLRAEPIPSRSAESLLARQVGDQIEFLSPLRHRPGRPLSFRLPASDAPLAATAAIRGEEGFKEYQDYRGAKVLGAARHIPGTGWGLVVKVDRDEALAGFGRTVKQGALALAGLLLAVAGLGFGAQRSLAARHRRELGESEARFELLARVAPVGIFRTDEHGNTTYVNRTWTGISGLTADRALGNGWLQAVHPEDRDRIVAGWRNATHAKHESLADYRLVRPDGTVAWVAGRASAVLDASGHFAGHVGTITDITERKRTEALAERERTFSQAALDSLPGLFYLFDQRGRFVRWNKNLERVSGYSADEINALSPTEFFADDEKSLVAAAIEQVFRTGSATVTADFLAKDKSRTPYLFTGTLFLFDGKHCVIGMGIDIAERKSAEEELKASERRIRGVLESMPLIGVILDVEGNITLCNDYLLSLTGWTRPEVLGRNWFDLFLPAEIRPQIEDGIFLKTIETGSIPVHYQNDIVTRAGERRLIAWNNTVLRDHGGNVVGIASIGEDITQRQRAEAAVAASEQKYRQLFEAADDAIVIFEPDGEIILEANRRACELYGFRRDELLGRSLKTLTVDVPRGEYHVAALRQAGVYRNLESQHLRRDGTTFPVLINSRLIELDGREVVLSLNRDMTVFKRAQEALRASEGRLRAVAESASDAIVIADAEGRILDWNPGAARMFGYTEAEVTGQPLTVLIPERYRARHRDGMKRLAGGGERHIIGRTVELEGVRKDGSEFPLELSLGECEVAGGRLYTSIVRDITERKKLEEQLLQSQKMEAVGQLAGGVAHDFNNLLQAMLSLTQMLVVHSSDRERLKNDATELEQQVKRGAALTRQLLLFSRRETVHPERLDLNDVVRDGITLLRRLLKANVAITTNLAEGRLPVAGDRGQLGQVLLNLAVNAADAMPAGGRLSIETGKDDGSVWLKVADTGGGIPAAVRDHIFEPFFTTKGEGKGTGLGLSVVHGIVLQHRGTVTFESPEGEGTTFAVTLPRAGPAESSASEIADRGGAAPRGHGELVLVVEDEDAARQALADMLAVLGYTVTAAGSGEEADRFRPEKPFDVLLTDLMLPGISGSELAAGLQARWPDLRVVLMSGYAEDEAVRHAVGTGVVRFLQKPFDMDTLARELYAALQTTRGETPR